LLKTIHLTFYTLCHKVTPVSPNWAEENLNTIRTLMERTALYRRTLAPIMIYLGCIGVISAVVAELGLLNGGRAVRAPEAVALFWLCVGGVAMLGALLLARRQALGDPEPFWSPPTRRVAQSILPMLLAGLGLGLVHALWPLDADNPVFASNSRNGAVRLIALWLICYGGALHAAGFFMERGLKLFGWCFLLAGLGLFFAVNSPAILERLTAAPDRYAHLLMGICFGCGHLAYGVYLYFTEENSVEETGEVLDEETLEEMDEA